MKRYGLSINRAFLENELDKKAKLIEFLKDGEKLVLAEVTCRKENKGKNGECRKKVKNLPKNLRLIGDDNKKRNFLAHCGFNEYGSYIRRKGGNLYLSLIENYAEEMKEFVLSL